MPSDALSEWLRLREAADCAARSEPLVRKVSESIASAGPLYALDLCTGSGSNLRYLIERLPRRQRWLAIDRDPALLAELHERLSAWAATRGYHVVVDSSGSHIRGERLECDVETRLLNLDTLDDAIFEGRRLVTASALLDLVSERWLRELAARCRAAGASALFAVTYNGRSPCDPVDEGDDLVRTLFNQHQKTDKGLGGLSAGPDAWSAAERAFRESGYSVERASSDWQLDPDARELQRELIRGWAEAAVAMAPDRAPSIEGWLRRRLAHVEAGRSRILVGHCDMAAWLP